MSYLDKIKGGFIAVFTVISSLLGNLATPFYFLVLTNVLDYVTGIFASRERGEKVSSAIGAKGIVKKVCMWLLVLVGYILDYIILTLAQTAHIQIGFTGTVAFVVIFWLMINEIISILENVHDIGVDIPLLTKLAKYILKKTEEMAELNEGE